MENLQVIEALCDALENLTMTNVRTRKSANKSKGEVGDKETSVLTYPNADESLWYKYEQVTTEHRFSCDSLRKAPNALELIIGGEARHLIIESQKSGRMLSADKPKDGSQSAFDKIYKNVDGITIDVLAALKKNVKEVSPETVKKQFNRLSKEQQVTLLREQAKIAGIDFPETE